MPIRCVIVDDEPPARDLLRAMLAEYRDVEVVAEYGNGAEAVEGIERERPDLVFLDIQMPEGNGFDVIGALDPASLPPIVFVTAYDQYALKAFEVHALDYLLKPFDRKRLALSVQRARDLAARPRDDRAADREAESRRLMALVAMMRAQERSQERLAVRVGERTVLQRVDAIDRIEADAKFARIHVGEKVYTMRETMRNLERRLDPARFLRVSRSAIVNVDRVREIQPWFNGDYVLVMQDGSNVTTTRGYRDAVTRLLGRGGD